MVVLRKLLCWSLLTLALVLSGCGSTARTAQINRPVATVKAATPTLTPTPTLLPTPTPTPTVADPARLVIPALAVNAPIEKVGIAPDGNMETPTQNTLTGVGWYDVGPRPGEPGSAVIDGHLDGVGGVPAIFWNLHNLHVGDSVMVVDSAGKTLHFRVTRLASYPRTASPVQEIFGSGGGTFLNLITCAGDWDVSQQQMTQRLVVYTTLEN